MAGAQAGAVVTVEAFVEQNEVSPVWVIPVDGILTMDGSSAVFIAKEDSREPPGQLGRDFP